MEQLPDALDEDLQVDADAGRWLPVAEQPQRLVEVGHRLALSTHLKQRLR